VDGIAGEGDLKLSAAHHSIAHRSSLSSVALLKFLSAAGKSF